MWISIIWEEKENDHKAWFLTCMHDDMAKTEEKEYASVMSHLEWKNSELIIFINKQHTALIFSKKSYRQGGYL